MGRLEWRLRSQERAEEVRAVEARETERLTKEQEQRQREEQNQAAVDALWPQAQKILKDGGYTEGAFMVGWTAWWPFSGSTRNRTYMGDEVSSSVSYYLSKRGKVRVVSNTAAAGQSESMYSVKDVRKLPSADLCSFLRRVISSMRI